jgi:hypothetical protein
MQQLTIFELLQQVLTSWQVIAVTIALVLYIKIVSYVSKRHHRPRALKFNKPNILKRKEPKAAAKENEDDISDSDSNDELGLEEA